MSFRHKRKGRNPLNGKILVDTSVWIEFFKIDSEIGDSLASLIINNSVIMCGIVLFELLQGVKSETERSAILNAVSELPYIEMNNILWQKSSLLSTSLRKNGITLPVSDILIATIALEHNISIFTLDKHFESISGVALYKLR